MAFCVDGFSTCLRMAFCVLSAPADCEETQADVQREMDVLQCLKLGSCNNVVRMFDWRILELLQQL